MSPPQKGGQIIQVNDTPDIFISHASEDKQTIAAPLAKSLKDLGYSVWYDEFTMKLGDSIRGEIDKGLVLCRYGVVILSHTFFSKQWPKRELDGLLAREVSENRKRLIPIRHNMSIQELVKISPMLADRVSASTDQGIEQLVTQIAEVVGQRA